VHAQVSFVVDNPLLPVGSRKTWDVFIEETGSKRNPDSLKSQAASVHFKNNLQVLLLLPRPRHMLLNLLMQLPVNGRSRRRRKRTHGCVLLRMGATCPRWRRRLHCWREAWV